jgi:apolipoprotein N-acyltransferase
MKISALKAGLPSGFSAILSIIAAILLVLAFPDFDLWFLADFALIPLLYAIEREKESLAKSFLIGWLFGTLFFTGSCWWLTYSLITYGGIPMPIAYLLLLIAASMVGIFSAFFTGALSLVLRRFGVVGILSAPFFWIAAEYLRFYLTGNNWNAIAYSRAFKPNLITAASAGGIYLVGFSMVLFNSFMAFLLVSARELKNRSKASNRLFFFFLFWFPFLGFIFQNGKGHYSRLLNRFKASDKFKGKIVIAIILYAAAYISWSLITLSTNDYSTSFSADDPTYVVAIQPNVPMGGMKYAEWNNRRDRHIELAEEALQKIKNESPSLQNKKIIVVFPESPMNFGFTNDREFQQYLREFTTRNKVEVLFNASEPSENGNFYNSALLVNERAEKIAQYDKIHLVPFGEYVPLPEPLASAMPTMAGSFEFGKEYDIVPFGDAKAGIMICFESHFPTLSREFALRGADVLIEMTNDGYLGETPVLRQHLASAVFRALETNRPVLRATNVGITAYVNEQGKVSDELKPYTEGWRVWSVSKSNGEQTFYVKYGDWVAWMSVIVSLGLLIFSFWKRRLPRAV